MKNETVDLAELTELVTAPKTKKTKEKKDVPSALSKESHDRASAALALVQKTIGKESIILMSDKPQILCKSISTGSSQLDALLSIGGLPVGRIVEIFGPESSGKTSIALSTVAQAQKNDKVVAYIDAEHAIDVKYAADLGVNMETMLVSQPDNGEQALQIATLLAESGKVDVIVIDSVAALTPKDEIEGDIGDSHMGKQARLMGQGLRKLVGAVNKNNVLVIFINQLRMKIGVMFGNPETTSGGNALKFYASIRLDVRRSEVIKEGDNVVGHKMKVKIAKTKLGNTVGRSCEVPLLYGKGISRELEIYEMAKEKGVIAVSGASHTFEGEKIAKSRANCMDLLKTDKSLQERVVMALKAAAANPVEEKSTEEDEEAS